MMIASSFDSGSGYSGDIESSKSTVVDFMLNSRVGQKGKEILMEVLCRKFLNQKQTLFFINLLLVGEKMIFPLDAEYLSRFKEDLNLWTKIEMSTFNNKLAPTDSKSRLNKI